MTEQKTEQKTDSKTDQKSLINRATKVAGDVAVKPVVDAARERAQNAARGAGNRLPATQQDIQRLTEQLDRIEAAVAALAEQVEAARPKRRAASAGSSKTES
jgi:uncharacterized protein (DUF1778 family)